MSTQQTAEPRPGVPYDTFATRLRLARIYAGDLSIDTAAVKCGLKPATWSTWERGVHRPPHLGAIVKAVAAGLDVDEKWLLDGGPLQPDPGPTNPDGPKLRAVGSSGGDSGGSRGKKRRHMVYSSQVQGALPDILAA